MSLSQNKSASEAHAKSLALMKFLSGVAKSLGPSVGRHIYVVGGAVRDFVLDRPIKDVDVVIDSVALGGKRDSEWFAKQLVRAIPTRVNLVTNQYGVALLNIAGPWVLDGLDMQGEDIEIANARKESYGGEEGKGYKPHMVEPSTIEEDVVRRELTYNSLMLRLVDLASGPDKKDIVDLTGCGLRDLEEGVMRCPRDPDIVFSDDPSRMIRVIKFALRYGHKLTPDTLAAIRRNAAKLKNVPSSHLAQLLTQIVLKEGTWKKALQMMDNLNLLDPVREMVLKDRGFRTTLENYVHNQRMDMLFGLMDVGLPLGASLGFLSGSDQTRLREITLGMDREEAWEFLGMLKNPGNAWKDKKFLLDLAAAYGFQGKGMKDFAPEVTRVAQKLLLEDPSLSHDSTRLKKNITDEIRRVAPLIRTAGLTVGDYKDLMPGGLVAKSASKLPEVTITGSGKRWNVLLDGAVVVHTLTKKSAEMWAAKFRGGDFSSLPNYLRPKTAKMLDIVWVVTDPSPNDEIIDILYGTSNMRTFENVIRGSRNWASENPRIHSSVASARKDAVQRLQRIHKGDIPSWVFQNEGQGFKMASHKEAAQKITDASDIEFEGEFVKISPIKAVRMDAPFEVETLEGVMKGKAGDWLAQGVEGERWPIDAEIFEKTYKPKSSKKAAPEKYGHIDFKPPQDVADAAAKGLEYRQKASPSNRGGLTTEEASQEGIGSGVQRATNLKNRNNISPDTIRQMVSFFARHEKNKGVSQENKSTPWNDKGHVAWLLWGGDPGKRWAEKVRDQMDAADKKKAAASVPSRVTPATLKELRDMKMDTRKFTDADWRVVVDYQEADISYRNFHEYFRHKGLLRIPLYPKAAAVADYIPGDGSSVGIFIPLPDRIAEQFPEMEDDKSPSHVTLLYVGPIPEEERARFLDVVHDTLSQEPSPIKAWLSGVDCFVHPHADRKVFYTPVRFSRDVAEIRDRLWVKLEEAGFEVLHNFPLAFNPHVTLAYMPDAHDARYTGPEPSGSWEFDFVQVWGFPDVYDISLGSYRVTETLVEVAQRRLLEQWDFLE